MYNPHKSNGFDDKMKKTRRATRRKMGVDNASIERKILKSFIVWLCFLSINKFWRALLTVPNLEAKTLVPGCDFFVNF